MPSKLVEEGKKERSKFEQTRSILYGDRYANVNTFMKGW